jgi:hypothetical protein
MGAEDDGRIYGTRVRQPDAVDVGFTRVRDEDRFQHDIGRSRQLAGRRHIGIQSSEVQHGRVSWYGRGIAPSLHRHGAPERNTFLRPSRVQIHAPKVGDCCSVGTSYVPAWRARRLTPAMNTRETRDATRRAWQSVVRIPLAGLTSSQRQVMQAYTDATNCFLHYQSRFQRSEILAQSFACLYQNIRPGRRQIPRAGSQCAARLTPCARPLLIRRFSQRVPMKSRFARGRNGHFCFRTTIVCQKE